MNDNDIYIIKMVQHLLEGNYDELRFLLGIVIFTWLLVGIAIIIDLISGVRKAKERGEMRTSYGFKQTVNKVVLYYGFMIFALMFDCIGMFFYSLPFVTLISALFLIFIECKSVFEKARDKDKRKFNKGMQELAILLENKDDLVKGFVEVLRKELNQDDKRLQE